MKKRKTKPRKPDRIIENVEAFVSDIDADIDSQVRELSLDDYLAWLTALRDEFQSRLGSRIEACLSDIAKR